MSILPGFPVTAKSVNGQPYNPYKDININVDGIGLCFQRNTTHDTEMFYDGANDVSFDRYYIVQNLATILLYATETGAITNGLQEVTFTKINGTTLPASQQGIINFSPNRVTNWWTIKNSSGTAIGTALRFNNKGNTNPINTAEITQILEPQEPPYSAPPIP